jgi:hypothetical protein
MTSGVEGNVIWLADTSHCLRQRRTIMALHRYLVVALGASGCLSQPPQYEPLPDAAASVSEVGSGSGGTRASEDSAAVGPTPDGALPPSVDPGDARMNDGAPAAPDAIPDRPASPPDRNVPDTPVGPPPDGPLGSAGNCGEGQLRCRLRPDCQKIRWSFETDTEGWEAYLGSSVLANVGRVLTTSEQARSGTKSLTYGSRSAQPGANTRSASFSANLST